MEDKRGAMEYGFLSGVEVKNGYVLTYEDETEASLDALGIGLYTKEEYDKDIAELKKKYNIKD